MNFKNCAKSEKYLFVICQSQRYKYNFTFTNLKTKKTLTKSVFLFFNQIIYFFALKPNEKPI